jgi:hypothetical protein
MSLFVKHVNGRWKPGRPEPKQWVSLWRTPRSAADALVGLSRLEILDSTGERAGPGGTHTDQGIRPTTYADCRNFEK